MVSLSSDDPFWTISGLRPLGGSVPQLRLTYVGSFDEPVYITVTFAGSEAELRVLHLGSDLVVALGEVIRGGVPRLSATRREVVGAVESGLLERLRGVMQTEVWALEGRPLSGCDGYTISIDAYDPDREGHHVEAWCPPLGHPVRELAGVVVVAACAVDSSLRELGWVREMRG